MIINESQEKSNPFDGGDVCATKLTHMLADYYFSGLPVFPVRIDKTPTVRWTKAAAGQTFAEFADMLLSMGSDATGIGLALGVGQVPLVARDYDTADGYDSFCRQHPEFAKKLPVSKTHRGYHVYFRPEHPIRTQRFNDGELRGTGSYVILPPSLHLSGDCYTWLNPLPLDIGDVPMIDPIVFLPESTRPVTPTDAQTLNPQALDSNTTINTFYTNYVTLQPCDGLICNGRNRDVWLSNLPVKFGTRNRCILSLVRTLKTTPPFCDVTDTELLIDGFHTWHQAALLTIRTKDFGASWHEFRAAWRLYDPERYGLAKALGSPPVAGIADAALARLAGVCRYLAARNTKGLFYLSARTAAKIIGAKHATTGQRAIEQLVASRHIRIVRRGQRRAVGGRATLYRWIGGAQ